MDFLNYEFERKRRKNKERDFTRRKCDAIQKKVHKVEKLILPNTVKIGRGDRKEY